MSSPRVSLLDFFLPPPSDTMHVCFLSIPGCLRQQFYIIPLAKKLKECGVFGVSSDEYLNYALKNREEWVAKGRGITAEVMARVYLHK